MTAYFDTLDRQVSDASDAATSDDDFLDRLAAIEAPIIATVNLVTGDREFPDEHREKIQGIIAVQAVRNGYEKADKRALAVKMSWLFQDLHDAFHDVARERIQTRFGMLTDSPRDIVRRRDDHDSE